MKKLLVLLLALIPATIASADDDRPVTFEQLPAAAREFIKTHFPDAKVTLATTERGLWATYDVIFTDGTKIEFDSAGAWKEIDCKYSHVPQGVLPPKIVAFLKEHYPDARVKEIERDRRGYEMKLDNRLEMRFDAAGNFRGYDD